MENWTVRHALAAAVARGPARPFLQVVDGPLVSYGEISDLAHRVARGLRDLVGLRKGDLVMTMLPNGLEVIAAWLGCGVLGAIEVCLNTSYRGGPLVHAVNACGARVLVLSSEALPAAAEVSSQLRALTHLVVVGAVANMSERLAGLTILPWEALLAEAPAHNSLEDLHGRDLAAILYTSGTTGSAKPVLLTHAQNYLTAHKTRDCVEIGDSDVSYCFHPMFHMAGKFMAAYGSLLAGSKLVLDRRFVPEAWISRVREFGATIGYGHGPMLEMIHAVPPTGDDANHKMTRVLAAPFPRRIAKDFERRFGVRGLECWGMTEIGIVTWPGMHEKPPFGSCGRVDRSLFDLRIVDPETDEELPVGQAGEMVVRAQRPWILFQGYLGMPDATLRAWRNGWFHTGDTGRIDADGYVHFVDRVTDKIRRRAENIASYDIESAAGAHPAIAEAAAVGVPSGFEGDDDIKLSIVLRAGAELAPAELIEFLAAELPHHMVPRYVERLKALPRSPTNKVRKAELRASGIGPGAWDRKVAGMSLREVFGKVSGKCG
ncbi:MAG: ATP-dependent acyl-CoA ligase [Hyphomicrobiaceae bacterium]|nr:MAG: ATP-dependent acyl-CoA ligase [Hyphomicrobiaceae bacterium]